MIHHNADSRMRGMVDVLDWARLPEDFRREIERQHVMVRAVAVTENVSSK